MITTQNEPGRALRHLLSATAAAAFALGGVGSVKAEELVVSIWGGSYAEEFEKHVAEPFEQAHGVDVVIEGGRSSERLSKLMAARGSGVDVFYITDYQMAVAKERGLLEPVRSENLEHYEELYDFAKDPLGGGTCPAFTVLAVGLAYNARQLETPPRSWNDLLREDVPGKVGYPDMGTSYAPLVLTRLAELNGGGLDNLDPGWQALKAARERLQIFRLTEVLDWINQGEVSIAPQLNIFVKKEPTVPLTFAMPEDGALGVVNLVCVVKGTAHRDLAEKLIDYHLSPEAQLAMAVNQGESPTNRTVEVPDDLPFNMVVGRDVESLRLYDPKVIADQRGALMERWQEQIVAQ